MLGVGAWLLGAVSATAGSLYAVDQLGKGLFEQHAGRISVAVVNAELAQANSGRLGHAPAPSPSPPSTAPGHSHAPRKRAAAVPTHRPAQPGPVGAGKLLTSAGGTAEATCQNGLARLLYWSPQQGFAVDHVEAGPSSVAEVTFTDSSGGVVMHVTCSSSGVPAAHVSTFQWGGGTHHDE